MVDIVNSDTRSRMMANIRSTDTKPELMVRKHLHKIGFRFRLNCKVASTKPDLVLPRWGTCIFVHGCYWHRHEGCKLASTPKTNTAFWLSKFERNTCRDKRNVSELKSLGWSVGIIWECSVRNGKLMDTQLKELISNYDYWEI